MKYLFSRFSLLAALAFILTTIHCHAQSPDASQYWITGNDHLGNVQTMYFGNATSATYCMDDGIGGTHNYWESITPEGGPPSGWDVRWRGVRTTAGNACIVDGLFPRDYRAIPSNPVKKDTFKLFFGNIDYPDSAVSFTWQDSKELAARCDSMYFTYTDPLTSSLVKVDMFAQSTWDIPSATINGAYIFITIYKFGCNIVDAISENEPEQAQTIRLRQNYPNPFNPVTTLSYELPARIHVMLFLFQFTTMGVLTER